MNTESDQPEFHSETEMGNKNPETTDNSGNTENETIDLVENKTGNEVEQLKAQLAEAEKQVLLAQADMDNFRKRNRRETQDQIRYASLGLMGEILDAVDNLERAIAAAKKEENAGGLMEGVSMVAQQISQVLSSHGCQKIDAIGQAFDPNLHQAVQMQPSDEFEANVVIEEMRAGFRLHDRVIRPSQVMVSTGPAK